MNKSNVIISSSDAKYGDFLINHWTRSLVDNVNLKQTDIIIIDYGLTEDQLKKLQNYKIEIVKSSTPGHITVARFIDAEKILQKTSYTQVLFVDSGDLIFQGDISHVFNQHKNSFRVVKLDMEVMFFEAFIPRNFTRLMQKKLWRVLRGKDVLNAGIIFAPREKFISLCRIMNKIVTNIHAYGPDQVIFNYVVYQDSYHLISKNYNFIPGTEREGFVIRDGTFYRKSGEKIIILHNAGHDNLLRPIGNFGYGKGFNHIKYGIYYGRRLLFLIFRLVRLLQFAIHTVYLSVWKQRLTII